MASAEPEQQPDQQQQQQQQQQQHTPTPPATPPTTNAQAPHPPPPRSADGTNNNDRTDRKSSANSSKSQPQQQQQQQRQNNSYRRNIRSAHTTHSKGGMDVVRRLHHEYDEPLQFDALDFQGLSIDELTELRHEVQHRAKVSNGVSWKRDMKAARGEGNFFGAKRTHTEGSELVLYSKPSDLKHICTPRIEPDTSVQKQMGDITITPGPCDYYPRPVESKVNSRWVGFLPSSPPKRLEAELKTVAPHPQSYEPYKPLGDDRPKYSLVKRPQFSTGGSAEDDPNMFCNSGTYIPPISDFDVDRKMPNGATAARFYIARKMTHHAPGPTDTAREGATTWVWKDRRSKQWQPVGNRDCLYDMAPPPSVVEEIRRKRAAAERASMRRQRQQQQQQQAEEEHDGGGDEGGGDNNKENSNNNRRRSISARRSSQQQQQQQSASKNKKKSATDYYSHHLALLLLSELHKRGYQLMRFAVQPPPPPPSKRRKSSSSSGNGSCAAPPTSVDDDGKNNNSAVNNSDTNKDPQQQQQQQQSTNDGKVVASSSSTAEQQSQQQQQQQQKSTTAPADMEAFKVHFTTKYNVADGFNLKAKSTAEPAKEFGVMNVVSKFFGSFSFASPFEKRTPPPPPSSSNDNNSSEENDDSNNEEKRKRFAKEEKEREQQHREQIQDMINKSADAFLEMYPDFAVRAKGRDFTYCSWLEKILKSSGSAGGLMAGDLPVKLEEAERSNFVYAVTAQQYRITAPPVK